MRREIIIRKLAAIIVYQDTSYIKRKTTDLNKLSNELKFLKDAEQISNRNTTGPNKHQDKQQRNLLAHARANNPHADAQLMCFLDAP